jgi:2,3-bisphosphoglycerate-independent phosphoglycerate mutase
MDGVAYGEHEEGDAVLSAHTPHLDWLHANCLHRRLRAHGTAVGMPSDGDMGNSEVGHNAIGAGRVFAQGAKLVRAAIDSGRLFAGDVWQETVAHCSANESALHFIGLLSDGSVHSHIDHLRALTTAACDAGVKTARFHLLLDGRDVGETSALDYFEPFNELLAKLSTASGVDYRIASGGGRMQITMDRYGADWSMVERGWDIHVRGNGRQFPDAVTAIRTLREETQAIDQDLPPFVIADADGPVGPVRDGDAVVMFNYRGDRAIELSNAFEEDAFPHFDRGPRPDVLYAGMMQYDSELLIPRRYLVSPPELDRTMGEYLASSGVAQWAVSETQKFGHVTYFFNGNRSGAFDDKLETYVEVTSDVVPFEQRPWMKAAEITESALAAIAGGAHPFVRLNFPNGDMVGHTGNYQAAEIAVASVDLCLGRLMAAVTAAEGVLVVCADHGNADEMYERDKGGQVKVENGKRKAKTSHTLNPVPCIVFDPGYAEDYTLSATPELGISSLSATCLNLLGFEAPDDYDESVISFR